MLTESNIMKHLYKIKEKKRSLLLKDLRKGRNVMLFLDERVLAGEEILKKYIHFQLDMLNLPMTIFAKRIGLKTLLNQLR